MEFGFYPTAYRNSRCLSVLLCHLVTLDDVDVSFVRVVNASVVHHRIRISSALSTQAGASMPTSL